MILIEDFNSFNFESVSVDPLWNVGAERELKMHRIHTYPAKFPAFITTKALAYARTQEREVNTLADIFCGCGTTAFEAKRGGISYWGCDINPVATLIAKTKSRTYQKWRLEKYLRDIIDGFTFKPIGDEYEVAKERLKYWYRAEQYNDLTRLKRSIEANTSAKSDYRLFFLCAFSNILKTTSVWLTKSIKPQVDLNKKPSNVLLAFKQQCEAMIAANDEVGKLKDTESTILTANFLSEATSPPQVDMIVTSPPYVTSYEYADLHQLSTLWLDFAEDYRDLREGAIGSKHQDYNFSREWKRLNRTGHLIVSRLLDQDKPRASSIAKYFLDMQKVAQRTYDMLEADGLALFVIGNTEYKTVRIDNAKHLAESLNDAGFSEVLASKRKVSGKTLTPYRDKNGKFSADAGGRKVYNEEFIVPAR